MEVTARPSEVSVTLRGLLLDEELVYFVRLRARALGSRSCDAVIERRG